MPGLGTVINVAAIIAGGLIGLLFGSKMKERVQEMLITACGVSTLFIGISGAMQGMLQAGEGGVLTGSGTMLIVASMALGGAVGGLADLDGRVERFGVWLRNRTGNEKDTPFVGAFVTASLTVCIGAMAVVGSIQDGIYGDYSILSAKAVLDLVIIMVMTASLGKGCIFSAIPVGLFQGGVTLLARLVEPLFTESSLAALSMVGSILIFCVGVNLVWGPKIKVANLLPALAFAIFFALLMS